MNPINIIKTASRENSSIEIIYKGNIDKDVDLEKAQKLLNDFVNTKKHSNMIENISIIKTILRDIDEDLLTVFYQDKECSVLVKYSNNKLLFYEKNVRDI